MSTCAVRDKQMPRHCCGGCLQSMPSEARHLARSPRRPASCPPAHRAQDATPRRLPSSACPRHPFDVVTKRAASLADVALARCATALAPTTSHQKKMQWHRVATLFPLTRTSSHNLFFLHAPRPRAVRRGRVVAHSGQKVCVTQNGGTHTPFADIFAKMVAATDAGPGLTTTTTKV